MIHIIRTVFWLFFMWMFLLMGRRWHPMWDVFNKYRFAHRGFHDKPQIPENSLPAFRRAVENGYGAELDVHLLKDGTLAIIHDSDIGRCTGLEGIVEDLTLEDLANCRLEGTEETIPTFDQVLEIFEGKTPLIIELKVYNGNHKELAKAVCERLDSYTGDFCIESFDFRAVRAVKKLRPTICRGQLASNFIKNPKMNPALNVFERFIATNLLTNILCAPDFVAYQYEDRKSPANRLCLKFWGVHAVSWTIRTPEDLKTAEAERAIPIFEKFDPRDM